MLNILVEKEKQKSAIKHYLKVFDDMLTIREKSPSNWRKCIHEITKTVAGISDCFILNRDFLEVHFQSQILI